MVTREREFDDDLPGGPSRITVSIPAIEQEHFFARMDGEEQLSQCFSYSLLISCKDMNLKPETVLGTPALVTHKLHKPRHFHGFVTDFALEEIRDDLAFFRLTLRPWLWFLSLETDNRIFQEKSVPDIVEEVFRDWPEARFKSRIGGRHDTREYCVQYGESDLDFVQRLLEDEGIFYYFTHDETGHVLILCDSNPAKDWIPLTYQPDVFQHQSGRHYITHWAPRTQVSSGKFTARDYDFEKPALDLTARQIAEPRQAQNKAELYHYPGRYVDLGTGEAIAKRRLEEAQADHCRVSAKTTALLLAPGQSFVLQHFPREVENGDYFVVSARYSLWDEELRAGQASDEEGYEMSMVVSPHAQPFRPPRITPRPRMAGPQTAVVVGPAGSEIFTDKYSRVKVQFHWDRQGRHDENTSCFIRVSSVWAGAGWGFIQIPRIGQEVIVDFLEGDPDQPLITGRVYNAQQPVPYGLPDNASQSGWKSWSTPGGGGWNELRFEDKAGAEEVYFQAQKDHREWIKHNETRQIDNDFAEDVGHDAQQSIGHDRTESVGHDKQVSVGNNRTVQIGVNDDETVGSNRSLTVGANETISIGSNSTETIGANHSQTVAVAQTITVGAARTDTVGAAEVRSVGAGQINTVAADRRMTVGSDQVHAVGSNDQWSVGSNQSIDIGADQTITIGGGQVTQIGKDQIAKVGGARGIEVGKSQAHKIGESWAVKAGKTIILEAGDAITLKCGSAAIAMKKDGTITIEGKDITLKGSGKINAKASGDVVIKGSKILNN